MGAYFHGVLIIMCIITVVNDSIHKSKVQLHRAFFFLTGGSKDIFAHWACLSFGHRICICKAIQSLHRSSTLLRVLILLVL